MEIIIILFASIINLALLFYFCRAFYELWARPVAYFNKSNAWMGRMPWLFKSYQPLEEDQLGIRYYVAIWIMRVTVPFGILLMVAVLYAISMILYSWL